ncbi:MAG TPA: HmuY family protein [Brumimicrobium sp.]|nr:HmuY family protein [Brumimicrobium sp.]
MRFTILFIGAVLLSSCLKEELPVPKREVGNLTTAEVNIGSDYGFQVYFDFSTNQMTGKNAKDIWDIGFESGDEGKHVIINTAKNMFVYATNEVNLADITSQNGYLNDPKFDNASGDLDSTGVGNWEDGFVRIIDMGYTAAGVQQGFYKLKITEVTPTTYTFEFASIESTTSTTVSIAKDDEYNFTYYSMLTKSEQSVAPKTRDWDIIFTQYIHQFYEPVVTPYLVTGCISNRTDTKVKMITEVDFDSIDLAYASTLVLSENTNTIGFGWKTLIGDNYEINTETSYLIQDHEGIFYKIRFIDFYTETGEKGNPVWEFQEL